MFFTLLKSELSPVEDRGVIQVSGTAPEGSTLAYTRRYSEQVENCSQTVPEIALDPDHRRPAGSDAGSRRSAASRTGASATRKQQEIVAELTPKLRRIAGRAGLGQQPGSLGAARRRPAGRVRDPDLGHL